MFETELTSEEARGLFGTLLAARPLDVLLTWDRRSYVYTVHAPAEPLRQDAEMALALEEILAALARSPKGPQQPRMVYDGGARHEVAFRTHRSEATILLVVLEYMATTPADYGPEVAEIAEGIARLDPATRRSRPFSDWQYWNEPESAFDGGWTPRHSFDLQDE